MSNPISLEQLRQAEEVVFQHWEYESTKHLVEDGVHTAEEQKELCKRHRSFLCVRVDLSDERITELIKEGDYATSCMPISTQAREQLWHRLKSEFGHQ